MTCICDFFFPWTSKHLPGWYPPSGMPFLSMCEPSWIFKTQGTCLQEAFSVNPKLRLYNLPPGAPRAPLPSLFLVRSPLASREITRAPRPQPQTCIFCTHPGACFAGPCPHSRACGWWVVPLNPRSHTSTLPSASSLGTIIVSETLLSPQTGWPHV